MKDSRFNKNFKVRDRSLNPEQGSKLTAIFSDCAQHEQVLTARSQKRTVQRRQYILQKEQVCRHYTYIEKGCLRLFQVDKKGNEHNLLIAVENEWITDLNSFYNESPSAVFIAALEPAIILQIKKTDLLNLYDQVPAIETTFRMIAEIRCIKLQESMLMLTSASAEERYKAFVADNPSLAARLPFKEIASLLGITPEFLSKVRKDIMMNRVHLKPVCNWLDKAG